MLNEILILAGFAFVIWFYIDTKKALEAIPEEMPEPIPAPIPYQTPPVPYIQPAPIQAPMPAPAPQAIPTEAAPAAAIVNREQLERVARNCLCASGCQFDTWTYCRYKSDTELMDIIKDYNLNR
jgi:hypothetical protein